MSKDFLYKIYKNVVFSEKGQSYLIPYYVLVTPMILHVKSWFELHFQ